MLCDGDAWCVGNVVVSSRAKPATSLWVRFGQFMCRRLIDFFRKRSQDKSAGLSRKKLR
jgi:phosphatidylserine decarboxylase